MATCALIPYYACLLLFVVVSWCVFDCFLVYIAGVVPYHDIYDIYEGDIRTARTVLCTARAPRVRFYQPFPAFFTFFQGGKDAVA